MACYYWKLRRTAVLLVLFVAGCGIRGCNSERTSFLPTDVSGSTTNTPFDTIAAKDGSTHSVLGNTTATAVSVKTNGTEPHSSLGPSSAQYTSTESTAKAPTDPNIETENNYVEDITNDDSVTMENYRLNDPETTAMIATTTRTATTAATTTTTTKESENQQSDNLHTYLMYAMAGVAGIGWALLLAHVIVHRRREKRRREQMQMRRIQASIRSRRGRRSQMPVSGVSQAPDFVIDLTGREASFFSDSSFNEASSANGI